MSNKLFINLFKNKNKTPGDNKPDYTASTKVGDKFIYVGGAWVKGEGDKRYLSLSIDMDKLDPTNSDDYQPPREVTDYEPF